LIDVEVEALAWTAAVPDAAALTRIAAEAALAGADGGLTILLADDDAVRDLNARFRGQHASTNVLSFPATPNPEGHLGDIILAFETCLREAGEQSKPLGHHLQHLTVHGVLHLLGHDHIGDDEAGIMEGLERIVLAELGVPDPYAAGDGAHDRP
jgi:probable rRNA maturation factor